MHPTEIDRFLDQGTWLGLMTCDLQVKLIIIQR